MATQPDPVVSVVVPTLNRSGLLQRVLPTVLGQDLEDPRCLEVVVVDDGSTDDTPQLLASWPDDRLRVVRHERPSGVAAARNAGTKAASGRWVAWCDDDDLWAPSKLRLQLEALASTPGARWSTGGAIILNEDLVPLSTWPCQEAEGLASVLLARNLIAGGGSGTLAGLLRG